MKTKFFNLFKYSKFTYEMYYIQERRKQIFKFFPRNSYHKIGNSNGCATILLFGPWKKTWEEYKAGKTTVYNWGKKLVA